MSTRAQRRADASTARRFERQIAGGHLSTSLIEAGASLDGHPHRELYRRAIDDAVSNPGALACLVCGSKITSRQPFAAFLLTCAEARPRIATASTICIGCWSPLDLSAVEIAAARALQHIVPGGRFIDPLPPQAGAN